MNEEGVIESLVDLEDDYVIVQKKDVDLGEILERKSASQSAHELYDLVLVFWKIRATPAVRSKYPSDNVRDRRERYWHSLRNRLVHTKNPWEIRTPNFESKYMHWVTSESPGEKLALIGIDHYGEAKARAEYIYKRVKIPLGSERKNQTLLFQPSKYLSNETDIWTLIVLVGEDAFATALEKNGWVLDRAFIERTMAEVKQPFFLSDNGKYLFAVNYDRIKVVHGPLKSLTALKALKYATVPQLEEAVEKISVTL